MDISDAVPVLAALAHKGRLAIFRSLVVAGPSGLAAGEIARRLDMLPNTLSANLTILANSGLVGSERDGRSIIYTAAYDRMTDLVGFLVQDCCNGQPEVCAPLMELAKTPARCPAP